MRGDGRGRKKGACKNELVLFHFKTSPGLMCTIGVDHVVIAGEILLLCYLQVQLSLGI